MPGRRRRRLPWTVTRSAASVGVVVVALLASGPAGEAAVAGTTPAAPAAVLALPCPGHPWADAAVEGCGLLLLPGLRFLKWDRTSVSLDDAFAPARLVFAGAPRNGERDPRQALQVWHRNVEGVWHAWGPTSPAGAPRLVEFEAGEEYAILASTPVAWSLPSGTSPTASIFATGQVVSYYGFPGVPTMGILGEFEPAEVMRQVVERAAAYDALNGDRTVTPALHLITAVAQASVGDGTYLGRLPLSTVLAYADVAATAGGLLIIDIQIGWSDPLVEVRGYEEALLRPNVHVALDPEFATKRKGDPPGQAIGSVTGDEVNAVQAYLAQLVQAHRLPPKALVVHQFRPDMILDPYRIASHPGVDLVIDMDGWGYVPAKLSGYEAYARAPYAPRPGLKIFFRWDTPVLTPEEVQSLPRPPDLIIYQ